MGDNQSDTSAMMQAAMTQLTGMVSGLQGEVQRLQAELAETREQAAAATTSVPAPTMAAGVQAAQGASKIKLPTPDKYDGSSQPRAAENFLFRCEQHFLGMSIPADKQVLFAAGLLTGGAASWWRFTCMAHAGEESLYDWDEFSEQLLARFRAVNSARHARDQLANLVQSGSVRTYASKMQELAMQIPDIGEGELKDRFIRGLKRRTQEQVVMQDPETFEKAVSLADRYDSLWGSANLFSDRMTRRTPSGSWATSARQPPLATNPLPGRTTNLGGSGPTPMEIDALQRKSTPLTHSERAHLTRTGGCFYCRQPGHMIADCPNKPPGKPPVQRTVAQVQQTAAREEGPDLIDLGGELRESENSMPQ